MDVDFVRKSIKAIGQTAVKIDAAAERCVNVLLDLIATRVSYVVQEAVVVMKVRFPDFSQGQRQVIMLDRIFSENTPRRMKVSSPYCAPILMNWMSQKPKHLSFGLLGNTRTKLITQTNCWGSLSTPSLKNHTLFVGTYSRRNVADKDGPPGTTTDSDGRRQIVPQQTRLGASHRSARFDNRNKRLRLSGCTGSSIYLLAVTIDRPWSSQGMYQRHFERFAWIITNISRR